MCVCFYDVDELGKYFMIQIITIIINNSNTISSILIFQVWMFIFLKKGEKFSFSLAHSKSRSTALPLSRGEGESKENRLHSDSSYLGVPFLISLETPRLKITLLIYCYYNELYAFTA